MKNKAVNHSASKAKARLMKQVKSIAQKSSLTYLNKNNCGHNDFVAFQ